MPKSKSRKRRFNLRRVRVTPALPLGTLASVTALTVAAVGPATSDYRAKSIKATWQLANFTAGEGPITVGYAHGDYSVTEIKEALEAANIDVGDKIAQEKANRLVRIVGVFDSIGEGAALNDGKPISTKLNWFISASEVINLFAYNESTALLTTGARVNAQGDMWVLDS